MLDKGIGPAGYHRTHYMDRDWRTYQILLSNIVKNSSPGPILDLGAGVGYLVECAQVWGLSATGLEGSAEAIELALQRRPDLDLRQRRLSDLFPFEDSSYQTVVMNQVIEHLESEVVDHVLTESLRVLRPGGALLITAPSVANKHEAQADPTHINMMSPGQLKGTLLRAGFARVDPFNSPLPLLGRGRLRQGAMSALFRLFPLDTLSATANAIAFKEF